MRNSALLMAVSASALLAGCTKGSDTLGLANVAPQSGVPQVVTPSAASTPLVDLALEALSRGDAAAAIPLAERALDTAPADMKATRVLAEATLMTGDPVKSESLFRTLVAADESSAGAKAGLGLSLLAQQRGKEAQSVLRDAAKLNPPAAVLSNIAFALTLAGAPNDAIALLEPMVNNPQSTPKMRQNLAFALVAANKRARAFEVAGYDLDGVSAARQVALWTDQVQLPMATQITQLAGLKVVDAPAYAQAAPTSNKIALDSPTVASSVFAEAKTENKMEQPVVRAEDIVVATEASSLTPEIANTETKTEVMAVKQSSAEKTQLSKVKVLKTQSAAPIQTASFSSNITPIVSAAPKLMANAAASVRKVEGWLVQVAAVKASTVKAIASVQREYRNLFGKSANVRLIQVSKGAETFQRVFVGQLQTHASAKSYCSKLRARGTSCLVRNSATAGSFASAAMVAKVSAPKPVVAKPVALVKTAPAKPVTAKTETSKMVKI
jgi:D-alanyl-D-alanine carboxypeptidase